MYGHVSGTTLEEFVVTKINKKNKPCEKVLCIDGFNIWHRERKEGQTQQAGNSGGSLWQSFSQKFLQKSAKKHPISSILKIARFDQNSFAITFSVPDKPYEPLKTTRYQVANPDDCSNIMAKIRFLVTQQVSSPSPVMTCVFGV